MTEAPDGYPAPGYSARTLGVRAYYDVPVDELGNVQPGTGGMSVSPETPQNLPEHRRPPEHGGSGRDPVWELDEKDLGPDLIYIQDDPAHGLVEPARVMSFDDFNDLLAETRDLWQLCL